MPNEQYGVRSEGHDTRGALLDTSGRLRRRRNRLAAGLTAIAERDKDARATAQPRSGRKPAQRGKTSGNKKSTKP